jgi:hypothetical protein
VSDGATPRPGRAADLGFAALCGGVAALIAVEARKLPPSPFDPLGPGAVPLWVAGLLGGLALLLVSRVLLRLEVGAAAQSFVLGVGGEVEHRRRPALALASLVLTAAYVAVMDLGWAGFRVATFGYLVALSALLLPRRARPQAIGVALAAAGALGLHWLFTAVLFVDLP